MSCSRGIVAWTWPILVVGSMLVGVRHGSAQVEADTGDPLAYEYHAEGKRDPFRPFALQLEAQSQGLGPASPLQRYEIGQLKLVGIIYDLKPPRAMVEDSAGLGFIVTPGTPVGPNGGVVTSIEPRQVVVVEWQTDVIGEKHRKEYKLELPADPVEPRQ